MLGLNAHLSLMSVLHCFIQGIRHSQGNSFIRKPRNIFSLFPDSCTQQIHAYHWLSYSLYGLLRVSEFSCPTFSFNDPDIHLLRSDVTFNLDFSMMFLHIITSKPDPFRRGATVRIAATFDKLCPVGAMRNY